MNNEESEERLNRRLAAALFSVPPAADPRSTEAFVARVMSRVAAESVSPWERFAARVLTPAFGLALAVLLLSIERTSALADDDAFEIARVDVEAVMGVAP